MYPLKPGSVQQWFGVRILTVLSICHTTNAVPIGPTQHIATASSQSRHESTSRTGYSQFSTGVSGTEISGLGNGYIAVSEKINGENDLNGHVNNDIFRQDGLKNMDYIGHGEKSKENNELKDISFTRPQNNGVNDWSTSRSLGKYLTLWFMNQNKARREHEYPHQILPDQLLSHTQNNIKSSTNGYNSIANDFPKSHQKRNAKPVGEYGYDDVISGDLDDSYNGAQDTIYYYYYDPELENDAKYQPMDAMNNGYDVNHYNPKTIPHDNNIVSQNGFLRRQKTASKSKHAKNNYNKSFPQRSRQQSVSKTKMADQDTSSVTVKEKSGEIFGDDRNEIIPEVPVKEIIKNLNDIDKNRKSMGSSSADKMDEIVTPSTARVTTQENTPTTTEIKDTLYIDVQNQVWDYSGVKPDISPYRRLVADLAVNSTSRESDNKIVNSTDSLSEISRASSLDSFEHDLHVVKSEGAGAELKGDKRQRVGDNNGHFDIKDDRAGSNVRDRLEKRAGGNQVGIFSASNLKDSSHDNDTNISDHREVSVIDDNTDENVDSKSKTHPVSILTKYKSDIVQDSLENNTKFQHYSMENDGMGLSTRVGLTRNTTTNANDDVLKKSPAVDVTNPHHSRANDAKTTSRVRNNQENSMEQEVVKSKTASSDTIADDITITDASVRRRESSTDKDDVINSVLNETSRPRTPQTKDNLNITATAIKLLSTKDTTEINTEIFIPRKIDHDQSENNGSSESTSQHKEQATLASNFSLLMNNSRPLEKNDLTLSDLEASNNNERTRDTGDETASNARDENHVTQSGSEAQPSHINTRFPNSELTGVPSDSNLTQHEPKKLEKINPDHLVPESPKIDKVNQPGENVTENARNPVKEALESDLSDQEKYRVDKNESIDYFSANLESDAEIISSKVRNKTTLKGVSKHEALIQNSTDSSSTRHSIDETFDIQSPLFRMKNNNDSFEHGDMAHSYSTQNKTSNRVTKEVVNPKISNARFDKYNDKNIILERNISSFLDNRTSLPTNSNENKPSTISDSKQTEAISSRGEGTEQKTFPLKTEVPPKQTDTSIHEHPRDLSVSEFQQKNVTFPKTNDQPVKVVFSDESIKVQKPNMTMNPEQKQHVWPENKNEQNSAPKPTPNQFFEEGKQNSKTKIKAQTKIDAEPEETKIVEPKTGRNPELAQTSKEVSRQPWGRQQRPSLSYLVHRLTLEDFPSLMLRRRGHTSAKKDDTDADDDGKMYISDTEGDIQVPRTSAYMAQDFSLREPEDWQLKSQENPQRSDEPAPSSSNVDDSSNDEEQDRTQNQTTTESKSAPPFVPQPPIPQARAAVSAVLTSHFGPTKQQIIPFDLELLDLADNYDNTTGMFIATIPGTYVISVYLMSHPGAKVNARVYVNDRPVAALWADDTAHAGFYPSSSIQTIAQLGFGDQIYVMLVDGGYGDSWVHANYNVFTVFLLYEETFS